MSAIGRGTLARDQKPNTWRHGSDAGVSSFFRRSLRLSGLGRRLLNHARRGCAHRPEWRGRTGRRRLNGLPITVRHERVDRGLAVGVWLQRDHRGRSGPAVLTSRNEDLVGRALLLLRLREREDRRLHARVGLILNLLFDLLGDIVVGRRWRAGLAVVAERAGLPGPCPAAYWRWFRDCRGPRLRPRSPVAYSSPESGCGRRPTPPAAADACRGAAMYPATFRRMMSSACRSGKSANFSVSGAPVTLSPPTIRVPPIFAHSARICRAGTPLASSDTRPSLISSFSCAKADVAEARTRSEARHRDFMAGCSGGWPIISARAGSSNSTSGLFCSSGGASLPTRMTSSTAASASPG